MIRFRCRRRPAPATGTPTASARRSPTCWATPSSTAPRRPGRAEAHAARASRRRGRGPQRRPAHPAGRTAEDLRPAASAAPVPSTRGSNRPGSIGLGLYIAREVARSHGGRIDVTSSRRSRHRLHHAPAAPPPPPVRAAHSGHEARSDDVIVPPCGRPRSPADMPGSPPRPPAPAAPARLTCPGDRGRPALRRCAPCGGAVSCAWRRVSRSCVVIAEDRGA